MLGDNIENHLELLKVEPLYRCFFEEDLSFVDISDNEEAMKCSVDSIDLNSWPKFQDYMQVAQAFLDFGLPNVIKENFSKDFFLEFVLASLKAFPLRSHGDILRDFFPNSPKLRALLSFQDLYIGEFNRLLWYK